jgi:hypothetical protein
MIGTWDQILASQPPDETTISSNRKSDSIRRGVRDYRIAMHCKNSRCWNPKPLEHIGDGERALRLHRQDLPVVLHLDLHGAGGA